MELEILFFAWFVKEFEAVWQIESGHDVFGLGYGVIGLLGLMNNLHTG